MEPEVRYCKTRDGVRIAFTEAGDGPVFVSLIDPIVSHVGLEWSHPGNKEMLETEAAYFRLVRLDIRGTGLSDRVAPTSIDDVVLDIEAVVDRLGLEKFTLHANTSATQFAVAFAALHPDRVTKLVIIDGVLRSAELNASPQVAAFAAAAANDWETATEAIGAMAFGSGREETRVHGAYIRACVGPEFFNQWSEASADVTEMAATLPMPVLVMRHLGYRLITDEMTNHLVSSIPDARLVTVKGMWLDDIAGLTRRIATFVYDGKDLPTASTRSEASAPRADANTAVIFFADIADSTALTERLGDAAFRAAARSLDVSLRSIIGAAGGTVIEAKTLGDGVLATFLSASQAIEAALSCVAEADEQRLPVHLGLHAGDVIREQNNVFGGAVNIAARISALSAPGEVLVSDIVRGLARTSAGVAFEDRGEHALKGVGEPQHVYAIRQDA